MSATLDRLEATISARAGSDPSTSYVARLHAEGTRKIAQKVGEEAVETVIAAMSKDPQALTREAADLLFHLMVLLNKGGVPMSAVYAELDRREGTSGLLEKARRAFR